MTDPMPARDALPTRTPGLTLVQPPQRADGAVMPPPATWSTTCQCATGSPIPGRPDTDR